MAQKQFLIRIDEELINALSEAAAEFGIKSGNQVAGEVVERYLEFWKEAKEAERDVLAKQRATLGKVQPLPEVNEQTNDQPRARRAR